MMRCVPSARISQGVYADCSRIQSVSSDYDPAGIVVRSLIADVISLYETNRKEAATILLELPKWFKKGTFRVSKPARRPDDEQDMPEEEAPEGPNWSLENLIVEVRCSRL